METLGQLNSKEIELIYWLRTRFRWGEVVVRMENGIPMLILKAWESKDLTGYPQELDL